MDKKAQTNIAPVSVSFRCNQCGSVNRDVAIKSQNDNADNYTVVPCGNCGRPNKVVLDSKPTQGNNKVPKQPFVPPSANQPTKSIGYENDRLDKFAPGQSETVRPSSSLKEIKMANKRYAYKGNRTFYKLENDNPKDTAPLSYSKKQEVTYEQSDGEEVTTGKDPRTGVRTDNFDESKVTQHIAEYNKLKAEAQFDDDIDESYAAIFEDEGTDLFCVGDTVNIKQNLDEFDYESKNVFISKIYEFGEGEKVVVFTDEGKESSIDYDPQTVKINVVKPAQVRVPFEPEFKIGDVVSLAKYESVMNSVDMIIQDSSDPNDFKYILDNEEVHSEKELTSSPMGDSDSGWRDQNDMINASDISKIIKVNAQKKRPTISVEAKKKTLASFYGHLKEAVKIKTASGRDSVVPAPTHFLWCPKLRRPMNTANCISYCIDARRKPERSTDPNKAETYQDYLIRGGSAEGKIICGYAEWLEREVDAFYPGWVEDHIIKAGGEVGQGDVDYARRMNLEFDERRHLPRYPEEKLVEKQLDTRHEYVCNTKQASVKSNQVKTSSIDKKKQQD